MTTAYTFVRSNSHEFPDHPERPGRFDVLESILPSFGAEHIESPAADVQQVARVHQAEMISAIEEACKQGPGIIDYAPTYVTQTSYADALNAAGGAIACTRAVLSGDAQNAFVIARPPGHHAEPQRAMGFCIFNNVAIAAHEALANGLERVMVVDYDAHHGNGTQAAFLHEQRGAFISTHQWGIYPGTGWIDDAPHARGRIINVPLQARAGDKTLMLIADVIFRPAIKKFQPQMLFVSTGFDAHWNDPITSLGVSTRGFCEVSKRLVELAGEFCDGRIVFVLEGGYDPYNVANGAAAVFEAATGSTSGKEVQDPSPYAEPDHESTISEIRKLHGLEA